MARSRTLTATLVLLTSITWGADLASADAQVAQLAIAHTAGSTPIAAGQDYTVTATITSLCSIACGNIPVHLYYQTPWGELGQLSKTLPPAPTQHVSFVIPGNAVRWWNTSTRTPYVFGYWLESSQTQGAIKFNTRAPSTPGARYERAVQNRFTIDVTSPTSSPLELSFWSLVLVTPPGQADPLPEIASGSFIEDTATIVIPVTSRVLEVAAPNDNFANFHLEVQGKDTAGTVVFGVEALFANVGNTRVDAATAGVFSPTAVRPTEVDPYASPGTCQTVQISTEWDPNNDGAIDSFYVKVAAVNAVYGSIAKYTYGQVGDTNLRIAVKIFGQPVYPSGSGGGGPNEHPGSWQQTDGYGHAGNAGESTRWKNVYPSGYQSKRVVLATAFTLMHTHKDQYAIREVAPDGCLHYETLTIWNWAWQYGALYTMSETVGHPQNDCLGSCPSEPALVTNTGQDGGLSTTAEKNTTFDAALCTPYISDTCLGGFSGYSTFSKIEINVNSKCNDWWVYGRGSETPQSAMEKFMDAGNQGGATNSAGVPRGCSA